jgi:hypothetical protein
MDLWIVLTDVCRDQDGALPRRHSQAILSRFVDRTAGHHGEEHVMLDDRAPRLWL